MKHLPKYKKKQIQKLGKLYSDAHDLVCELRDYLIEKGLDPDALADELNSLKIGDCNSQNFIEWIEDELDYLN